MACWAASSFQLIHGSHHACSSGTSKQIRPLQGHIYLLHCLHIRQSHIDRHHLLHRIHLQIHHHHHQFIHLTAHHCRLWHFHRRYSLQMDNWHHGLDPNVPKCYMCPSVVLYEVIIWASWSSSTMIVLAFHTQSASHSHDVWQASRCMWFTWIDCIITIATLCEIAPSDSFTLVGHISSLTYEWNVPSLYFEYTYHIVADSCLILDLIHNHCRVMISSCVFHHHTSIWCSKSFYSPHIFCQNSLQMHSKMIIVHWFQALPLD